jgi:Poxvirus A32 protein
MNSSKKREKNKKVSFTKKSRNDSSEDDEDSLEPDSPRTKTGTKQSSAITDLFDPIVMEAREKLNELADQAQKSLKAEEKATSLFQDTSDPNIQQLLERAKVNPLTFEELRDEIDNGICKTHEGNLQKYRPPPSHFDMNLFFLILGKRRTGKTHFLNDFVFNFMQHFKNFLVLTDTKFNGFWEQRIPTQFVKDGYNKEYIRTLFEIQIVKKIKMRKQYPEMSDKEINSHPDFQVVLILDDVISDKYKIRADEMLSLLGVQGRHYGITVFFISQYFYSVPTDVRGNIDVVIILNQTQKRQIEGIIETYLGYLNKHSAMKMILTVATERREIANIYDDEYTKCDLRVRLLVINVWTNKYDVLETLAYYAAEAETPDYKLMDPKYWAKVKSFGGEEGDRFRKDKNAFDFLG